MAVCCNFFVNCRLVAAFGSSGSDVPQARHSLPLPSILLYDCKKKSTPLWVLSFLVDPRRIDSRRLDARSVIAALTAV